MKYVSVILIFILGELVSLFIFMVIRKHFGLPQGRSAVTATGRGILERAVLYTGLLFGFPHILIAFGALKLGTRLHEEKDSQISNNYFLVGNLISMFLAMLYAILAKSFWQ